MAPALQSAASPTTVPPIAATQEAAAGSLVVEVVIGSLLVESSAAADAMGASVYVLAAQLESGLEPAAVATHKDEKGGRC